MALRFLALHMVIGVPFSWTAISEAGPVCVCDADLDVDSDVDVDDLLACSGCVLGIIPPAGAAACDVNCDGTVTACDCRAVSCRFGGGGTECCDLGCNADLTNDGIIDLDDLLACNGCQVGTPPPAGAAACDINCDGSVTPCDCRAVLCQFGGGGEECCALGCNADLTNDGIIDLDDLLACNGCQVGTPPPAGFDACDINCDGRISPCDCRAVLCQFGGGGSECCELGCNADLTNDGIVDVDDLLACNGCIVGTVPPAGFDACDINCDGSISPCDCRAVLCQFGGGGTECCALGCNADLTNDGIVDVDDILACNGCLNSEVPPAGFDACDVNCDGRIDACDCRAVSCRFGGGGDSCCDPCSGDLDNSGLVDVDDLLVCNGCLAGNYPPGGSGVCDINCDGRIGLCDCKAVACRFANEQGCCDSCDTDLDESGITDVDDLLAISACQMGVNPPNNPYGCDVDCDGDVDLCDARHVHCEFSGGTSCCAWVYGDSAPNGGDHFVDLADILCALDGYFDFANCPNADNFPCAIGDGLIDIGDILNVLDAYSGDDCCN